MKAFKMVLDTRFTPKELAECCQGAASEDRWPPCPAFGFKCPFGHDGNDEVCARVTTDMWKSVVDDGVKE